MGRPRARRRSPAGGASTASSIRQRERANPGERQRFAKTIVERAVQRVESRVIETRTVSASHESEETSTRVLDNTAGTTGRRGVYRWLDEIREARVVHYGTRLVLELIIHEPAARYLREALELPHDDARPVPPAAIGIET